MKSVKFIFRTDQYQADLINQAVTTANETVSEWLRSRAEAAANTEIAAWHHAHQTPENRLVRLGMSRAAERGGPCVHPVQARATVGVVIVCLSCGDPVGNLL